MNIKLQSGDIVANPGDLTDLNGVQAWLNLGENVAVDVLSRLISAQSAFIQNWLNRQIASQSYTEIRDGLGAGLGRNQMVFANYPVSSVSSLTIDGKPIPPSNDGGLLTSGFSFDTNRIWLADVGSVGDQALYSQYYFNKGRQNVIISYAAGYSTIPYDIEQACIELVAMRYMERTRVGLVSQNLQGQTTAYVQKVMTDSILTTLNQYKKVIPL
jgi:hypothetical protein